MPYMCTQSIFAHEQLHLFKSIENRKTQEKSTEFELIEQCAGQMSVCACYGKNLEIAAYFR